MKEAFVIDMTQLHLGRWKLYHVKICLNMSMVEREAQISWDQEKRGFHFFATEEGRGATELVTQIFYGALTMFLETVLSDVLQRTKTQSLSPKHHTL